MAASSRHRRRRGGNSHAPFFGRPSRLGCWRFERQDTHIHLAALCGRAAATELGRRVAIAVHHSLSLAARFKPCHLKPIVDQPHLYRAFYYILRQDERHELDVDPFHEASNLPDLLGFRMLGGYTLANVREHLPRVKRSQLLQHAMRTTDDCPRNFESRTDLVNLVNLATEANAPTATSSAIAANLVSATAAALAVPDLRGRGAEAVAGRAAAVQLASPFMSSPAIASLLGIKPRQVRRLRHRTTPPGLLDAISGQLELRLAAARCTTPPSAP
jgi:hypothetical protein